MIHHEQLKEIINRRVDFVYLFDVTDGNPNGDPDAGNLPRIDPQTLQGIVTDGCIKRKIRNAVEVIKGDAAAVPAAGTETKLEGLKRFEIYFKHQGVLNEINRRAYMALGIDPVEGKAEGEDDEEGEEASESETTKIGKKGKRIKDSKTAPDRMESARSWMCRNFFDVRTFGAVMSTGVNAGQVRGPMQITYARSVDPILPMEATITRKSVNKQEDADKQIAKHGCVTGTMGRKNVVPYALYVGNGFVNPYLAKGTGFSFEDLRLFLEAMLNMFQFDASSSHGTMALRQIHLFEHESPLGNARAFELIERVSVKPISKDADPDRRAAAPRAFEEYRGRIAVDLTALPRGVTHYELPRDWDKLFPAQ